MSAPKLARGAKRCLILANEQATRLRWIDVIETWSRRVAISLGLDNREPVTVETPPIMSDLAEMAADLGLEANVELMPPASELSDYLHAARREGYDTIVVAGGDGSIHAVAQALVGRSLRLGILPVGSSNNFARALGIPFELENAMRVIAEGEEQRIDVGRIGNEYFLEGAGVGLFADVICAYGKEEPHHHNLFKLARTTAPFCWNPPTRRLRLTLDGRTQSEEATMVTVANSTYLGEHFAVAPDAAMNDGLFDVIIVGALSRGELISYARAMRHGTHLELPKVRRVKAKRVRIERVHDSHEPIPVHADDHIVGYTPAELEVVPGALRVLVPPLSPVPFAE